MKTHRIAVWRRRIGWISAALGLLFFVVAALIYLRYASDPQNLHVQERLRHAPAIGLAWAVSFYGAVFLFLLSLLGIGWRRWVGVIFNAFAVLYGLMTLGAMCGPFGC